MLSLPSMMIQPSVSLYTAKRMGFKLCLMISVSADSPMVTVPRRADPMLTTVEQRGVAEVGEEAANILIGQVEGSIL